MSYLLMVPEYGYLAVFNNLAWKEVAWSKLKRGKLTFEKVVFDNNLLTSAAVELYIF